MNNSYQSLISKPEINFWVPIVVSVVTITLSYGLLLSRVSVLENKVDTLLANQERMLTKYDNVEKRYGELSISVAKLQAR